MAEQFSASAATNLRKGHAQVILLTVYMPDGRVIRVGSRPISVEDPVDTGPYQYDPYLLQLESFREEHDVFSLTGIGTLTQARVGVATTEDLATLQSTWYHFLAGQAEIALLWEGDTWGQREVIMERGQIQSVDFGKVGEVTSFTLEAAGPTTSRAIGDDSEDLGDLFPPTLLDTTATEMTDVTGSKHIYVIGAPAIVPAFKVGDVGGMNRLYLCRHRIPDTGNVTVYEDGASAGSYAPQYDSGGGYTYVEHATEFSAANGAYTWRPNGGVTAYDNSKACALTASGVLGWLLANSGLAVDWRAMIPALRRLKEWNIGLYLDQQATAIETIRERVLKYLPLIELYSGSGLWYAYADPNIEDIDGELVVGQQLLGRVGGMKSSDTDSIRNSFVLNYGYDPSEALYRRSVSLTKTNSPLCYLSDQLWPDRADDAINCSGIHDETTAVRALQARASRLCLPRRKLQYALAPDAQVAVGTRWLLTERDYNISGSLGVVVDKTRGTLPEVITLEMIDRTPFSIRTT